MAEQTTLSLVGGSDGIETFPEYRTTAGGFTLGNHLFGICYLGLCLGTTPFGVRRLSALNLDRAGFEIKTMMNIRAVKAWFIGRFRNEG
jgi:hypothetical protein